MADAIVLTDKAKFKCIHMPAPAGTDSGIIISGLASKTTVDGAKPILDGAVITGLAAAGCIGVAASGILPCSDFTLSAPASGSLTEGSKKVYIASDLAAIALVPATNNGIPGLVISESQTKLKA